MSQENNSFDVKEQLLTYQLSEGDKNEINGSKNQSRGGGSSDNVHLEKDKSPKGGRTLSGEFGAFKEAKLNPLVAVKEELTSGWFDTNEEFEQHRKRINKKLHQSVRDFNKISGNLGGAAK